MFNGTSWRLTLGNVSIYPDRWMPHLWYKLTLLLFIFQVQRKSCGPFVDNNNNNRWWCHSMFLCTSHCCRVSFCAQVVTWETILNNIRYVFFQTIHKQNKRRIIPSVVFPGEAASSRSHPQPTPEKISQKNFKGTTICDLYIGNYCLLQFQ